MSAAPPRIPPNAATRVRDRTTATRDWGALRAVRAFARHDWETLRGCLADDFVFRDHRTLALLGELRRDEWVGSLRVQADLAPDVDVETLWVTRPDVPARATRNPRLRARAAPLDVGAYETDGIHLVEVDAQGSGSTRPAAALRMPRSSNGASVESFPPIEYTSAI